MIPKCKIVEGTYFYHTKWKEYVYKILRVNIGQVFYQALRRKKYNSHINISFFLEAKNIVVCPKLLGLLKEVGDGR